MIPPSPTDGFGVAGPPSPTDGFGAFAAFDATAFLTVAVQPTQAT